MTNYKQIHNDIKEKIEILKNFPDIKNKPEIILSLNTIEDILGDVYLKYKGDYEDFKFQNFLLNVHDLLKGKITTLLMNLKDNPQNLNENASYSQYIDLKKEIAKLTKHMLDKGMNILPLPKLIFKNGDSENAKEFLGKTAYYDPNSMSIVLYTEGRHPKDIVRSFSHEMVHHTQNLEDRLGNITTTNTQEDGELNKIEAEANLKGTMTFRNWTDSLQERKTKDPFGINAYAMELGRLREEGI